MAEVEFEIVADHIEEIIDAKDEAIKAALIAIGMQAQSNATDGCPVDTGLLHNSIAYALDGEGASKGTYKADRGSKTGTYSGNAPADGDSRRSVYIGTNVEYATYVENGARGRDPKHFLRNAIQNNVSEYQGIIKKYLQT